jgi:hypothetical protein
MEFHRLLPRIDIEASPNCEPELEPGTAGDL